MSKFYSTLGTSDDLVYAVIITLLIGFFLESLIVIINFWNRDND